MSRRAAFTLAAALGLSPMAACVAPDASNDTDPKQTSDSLSGSSIASIALANVGGTACGKNTQGGAGFETSCTGNAGSPEYWCADFAQWVWAAAGADVSGLDAAAGSFYVYGQQHGTLSNTPHVGDAVVFDYAGGGVADHVAIVTSVAGDAIVTVSGDWAGQDGNGSEAAFASTSHVVLNSPAYAGVVGSSPAIMGMTISGFISPSTGGGTANYGSCSVDGVAGTCIDTGTCAGKSGYHSTAGLCPGPDDIECCTPDASSSSSSSGGGTTDYGSCSVNGVGGACIDKGVCAGKSGYESTAGLCPGPDNIECCAPVNYGTCSVDGVSGTCIETSVCEGQSGHHSTAGFCPGPDNIECCTP